MRAGTAVVIGVLALAGCCGPRTISVDPIHVAIDTTLHARGDVPQESPGLMGKLAEAVIAKGLAPGTVGGDLCGGCLAYYARHRQWPAQLSDVSPLLAESGAAADSLARIEWVEFKHWQDNGLEVSYRTAGPVNGVLRLAPPAPSARARLAFLGSSTTDGNVYPELIGQALKAAGLPAPLCFNAGAGGNTTAAMAQRLERDVLARWPTLVIIQPGANDASQKVTVEVFAAAVTGIAERLQAAKVPFLFLTTNIRGPKRAAEESLLVQYNAELRRLAQRFTCPVADAFTLEAAARAAGQQVLEEDSLHPNFAGHRLLARAILDAMGHPQVAVPVRYEPAPCPGVVGTWLLRALPDKQPLTPAAVQGLAPDATWKKLELPEAEPQDNWWLDGERRRGFALSLKTRIGQAPRYVGVAEIAEPAARQAVLNTGAGLQAAWLNGERVYVNKDWHGWHAGRERLPVSLKAGRNVIVIEATDNFFLSLTPDADW